MLVPLRSPEGKWLGVCKQRRTSITSKDIFQFLFCPHDTIHDLLSQVASNTISSNLISSECHAPNPLSRGDQCKAHKSPVPLCLLMSDFHESILASPEKTAVSPPASMYHPRTANRLKAAPDTVSRNMPALEFQEQAARSREGHDLGAKPKDPVTKPKGRSLQALSMDESLPDTKHFDMDSLLSRLSNMASTSLGAGCKEDGHREEKEDGALKALPRNSIPGQIPNNTKVVEQPEAEMRRSPRFPVSSIVPGGLLTKKANPKRANIKTKGQ